MNAVAFSWNTLHTIEIRFTGGELSFGQNPLKNSVNKEMNDAVWKRFNHNSTTAINGTNLNTLARLFITSGALTL